jgi:hypothetical protein
VRILAGTRGAVMCRKETDGLTQRRQGAKVENNAK